MVTAVPGCALNQQIMIYASCILRHILARYICLHLRIPILNQLKSINREGFTVPNVIPSKIIVALQVDDTLMAGNGALLHVEEREIHSFEHKARTFLSHTTPLRFNGMNLRMHLDRSIIVDISEHTGSLDLVPTQGYEAHHYVTSRAKGAYVVMVSRPDLAFEFSKASQKQQPTDDDVVFLNRAVLRLKSNPGVMWLVKTDCQTARVVILTDDAFEKNADHTSELAVIITLVDNYSI